MKPQVIVLSAGDGGRMGGVDKILLKVQGKTLLDKYKELFSGHKITIVRGAFGFLKSKKIKELGNPFWDNTNSIVSLVLALKKDPSESIILDADLFFDFYPKKVGFYVREHHETIFHKNKIITSEGWFTGIARTTKKQNLEFLSGLKQHNINEYWCNGYSNIDKVICDSPVWEFDTQEDYEKGLNEINKACRNV